MNSRFRPYRIILSRQGGSINIIQVTVYFFTVPALKLMNVKFCLFLATTAHCHDRAAIKIHITTFNCINLQVRCGNLHNFNCFWLSIYIYIWVLASTLDPSASEINKALSVTYKLLFILSKNIVPSRSYRYIRDRAFPVTRLPPPIYTKFDVKQRYIWVLASTRALLTYHNLILLIFI